MKMNQLLKNRKIEHSQTVNSKLSSTNIIKTNKKAENVLDFLSKCVKKKKEVGPNIDLEYAL